MHNALFLISGFLWSVELLPQLWKTYKRKTTNDLSLFYYITCVSAFIIFLIGCYLLGNWFLFFSHLIPFINLCILIVMIINYRKKYKLCKYWIELDDNSGMYEYCKYAKKRVTCCAEKKYCECALLRGK
jgi:uncharacterized protein with PQ loop repeat